MLNQENQGDLHAVNNVNNRRQGSKGGNGVKGHSDLVAAGPCQGTSGDLWCEKKEQGGAKTNEDRYTSHLVQKHGLGEYRKNEKIGTSSTGQAVSTYVKRGLWIATRISTCLGKNFGTGPGVLRQVDMNENRHLIRKLAVDASGLYCTQRLKSRWVRR